jgi:Tol biopolymer transport system component/DNA-binding winged helix-turn-helix (wHTH) protein
MSGKQSDRIQFGPFEADLHTHELWKHGTRIKLVGQPFEVLAIFLARPGELVTREELRNRLWPGDTFVDFNHGLNAAVNRLREALCDSAEDPRYVETLPRRGYRFIAPVVNPAVARDEAQLFSSVMASVIAPVNSPIVAPIEAQDAEGRNIPVVASLGSMPDSTWQVERRRRRGLRFSGGAFLLAFSAALTFGVAVALVKKVGPWAEAGVVHAPMQRIRPLVSLGDDSSDPAFSPDGSRVAFHRGGSRPEDSGIFVKTIGSDQVVQLTSNPDDQCPAWSPDGKTVAFARQNKEEFGIYMVPADGGAEQKRNAERALTPTSASFNLNAANVRGISERRLDTGGVTPRHGAIAWSPDERTIAFSGGASIFLLSLENSTARQLTQPPPLSEDWGPAFSSDGEKLLFVRSSETRFPEELMTISTNGGEATRILSEHARILGPPQWSFDGQSVIFASDRGSHPSLWRVSVDAHEAPVEINDSGAYPAVSRMGYRLAYQRITRSLSVWEMDVTAPGKGQHILVPSTSETDQGPGPQLSPDGKKLAFMSDRSGTMEIWVSDQDGRNPIQLTAIGSAGTPRWSPDGQSIVFDGRGRDSNSIYAASLKGGAPRMLAADGVVPCWSQDGKWIYFASRNSGDWQVWKVAEEGGALTQVTTRGGHAPLASLDGKYIYYAKTMYANPEIWQIPVAGGEERLVSALVRPVTWASWKVVDQGIVFAGSSGTGGPVVNLFSFATRRVRQLGSLTTVPFWLDATRDGNTVVFDQPGWEQAQLMLVENFR